MNCIAFCWVRDRLTVPDIHYEHPRLAEIYDLDSPWSIDRDFYLSLAGEKPQTILDLGCGTGLICDAYAAKGHDVTGVDPAASMLDVARRKPHGKNITWVQASAQDFRSDKRFDLIIMTGHAFQVLLEDADILAAMAVMRKHLKQDGRVVFESRNPAINWAKKWGERGAYMLPGDNVEASWRFIALQADRMTFELHYRFPDETLTSTSVLRFLLREGIEERLGQSGLYADKVLGDWDDTPFNEQSSEEMIFIVRKKAD
jgi:2-polyprenyl-3-methyl-5-hydroxy-6-metoxy-1,4-benzoquinol methylase